MPQTEIQLTVFVPPFQTSDEPPHTPTPEKITFLGIDAIWRELLTILGADTQTCGNWILDIYASLNNAKIQWLKVGCQVSIRDEWWLRLTCQLLEHAYLKQTELLQKKKTLQKFISKG